MSTIKPILYNINAFDATKTQTISFSWSGNQLLSNTCTIRNNQTNTIVYQGTQTTLQLKHTLNPNVLTNGILYNITIKVTDQSNTVSEESTPLLFYCYETPSFTINVTENQVIQNSYYQSTLTYTQSQGELLQSYQVLLYDVSKNQLWSSGVKYDTDNLIVTISSLEDNGEYYIRATGITINEMSLDTGYIPFYVNYIVPSVYAIVSLENQKKEGSIKIASNIISLVGKYSSEIEPTYISNDYIDLTENNVYFDEGFSINNNFTINLRGYNFKTFTPILELTDEKTTITLQKKFGIFPSSDETQKYYFELLVSDGISNYVIHSNYISLFSDEISIWVRKINGVYDLYAESLTYENTVNGATPYSNDYVTIDGGTPFTNDAIIIDGGILT